MSLTSGRIAKRVLPAPLLNWVAARAVWIRGWLRGGEFRPRPGVVRFGSLRRVTLFNRTFGGERGQPVDRYYIDRFLSLHSGDITGHVLEVAEPLYTRKFGGARVQRSEVLHFCDDRPPVTLVADLTSAGEIPPDSFDCIICTQTLQFIYDVPAAIATLHRILKPGGVLLATVPGITQISSYDMNRWGQWWSFTTFSVGRLFDERFAGNLEVTEYGNALAATAMLFGMAAGELDREELDHHDPEYQVLISIRAVKAGADER